MSWYKQTSVWGVVISVIALALTQLPPVGTWITRTKIEVELSKRVGLGNAIGIPGYQIFLNLKNGSNRTVDVAKFHLNLTYPTGARKRIEAQTYVKAISGQNFPQEFPMTAISIGVGTNWSEMVSFYPAFSPSDDEELGTHRLRISQSIFSKAQGQPQQFAQLVAADSQVVDPAIKFFTRKFDLEKGTYKVVLEAVVNGSSVTLKEFTFTLYDYHIETLRSQVQDYKFGAGIYFPILPPKQVWALLNED